MTKPFVIQIEKMDSKTLLHNISQIVDDKLSNIQAPTVISPDMKFLTRQQVADMFSVTITTVHSWVKAGLLKPIKIGVTTRFLYSDILKTLADENPEYHSSKNLDDLVSFGNYLLSDQRRSNVLSHPEHSLKDDNKALFRVSDADIENWKTLKYKL